MEISVTNVGMDYQAVSDEGMELSIIYGEEKPAEDKTMNPLAIFLSSLGMCVTVMLRKYVDAHGLDAPEIKVTVTGDFEAGDEACENIAVSVDMPGEWDERRKAAFLKVAETCPVHHTLCTCSHVDIEIA